jgi:hypothetical protein
MGGPPTPAAVPLFISEISRKNGVVYITVMGNLLTALNVGNKIQVLGVSDPSFNVTAKVSRVIPPNTICFNQPGLFDITGLKGGGAISTSVS